jgi:purine-cytosine permease-like protein
MVLAAIIIPGAVLLILYLVNKRRADMICPESMNSPPKKVKWIDIIVVLQVLAVKSCLETFK